MFDNVDDLAAFDIRDYFLKTLWGSILITSRRRDVSGCWTGIEVREMTWDEGQSLLEKVQVLIENEVLTASVENFVRVANANGCYRRTNLGATTFA
jgi:hypothetical protein